MNRKSKLFFSLVSLCFSIAILCFGVYSAMQVSYSVSGSVSYEVTDAFVEITTNVYASSECMEQSTLNSNAQNLEDPTYVNTYTKVGDTYTYNSMEELSETNQPKASGIEINYNNYYTYFIVINIKNLSSDVNIYALIEEDIIGTELNSNVYKTRYQNGIIKPQTGDNVGKNIVLGFSLNDATIGVNAEFDYTLNVNAGNYEPQAAVIDVVALDTTSIVSNANFDGSSYTFDVTSSSPAHTTFGVQPVWLYNVYLQDIDYQSYNSLVVTVHTNEVISGIGIAKEAVESVDDALSLASGISPNTDTHTSSLNVNANSQSLCFGIVTDNVYDIQSTVTITFANQLIDEENKLKYTQINNGTELSVSVLDETISGVVTIPSSYNGLPVTQIESGGASYFQDKHVDGFAYCDNITAIIIPETVKEIASYTFYYCNALETVTFGDNSQLESIGGEAFSNCSALKTVTFGENSQLGSIGSNAFYDCSNLTSIEIPSSVTSIGDYAFYGCDALATVTFGENSQLESIGSSAFSSCYALTSIETPSNLTSIGTSAFSSCSALTSIEIPSGVTSIGEYAFYNCDALETVTFGENSQLESIGKGAFNNCDALKTVTFGENSQLGIIGYFAFVSCSNLTSIEIPSSVTSIGDYAFESCSALETVTFGANSQLESIGDGAFSYCYALTSIEIPSSVTSIGERAFSGCYALAEVYNYSTHIPEVTLGNSSYNTNGYLGQYAKVVYNPSDLTTGEKPASRIQTRGDVQYYVYGEDYIALAPSVAKGSLTTLTLDSKTTRINAYAFYNCSNLTSITIPSRVTSIGNNAFSYCYALTSIEIPSSVTSIGSLAFQYCYALAEVYNYSTHIPQVTIGNSSPITNGYLGQYAKVVYNPSDLQGEKPATKIQTIGNVQYYVYGEDFIALAPSVARDSLTTLILDGRTTEINQYAFRYCYALATVTFEANSQLESIGSGAFQNCSNLTSIEIPSSVTSIGDYAFDSCSALETVTFGDAGSVWVLDNTSKTEISISEHTAQELVTYLTDTYRYFTWTKKQSA